MKYYIDIDKSISELYTIEHAFAEIGYRVKKNHLTLAESYDEYLADDVIVTDEYSFPGVVGGAQSDLMFTDSFYQKHWKGLPMPARWHGFSGAVRIPGIRPLPFPRTDNY
jgi:hypothetical protein